MSAAERQRPSAKHGLLRAGRRARSASDLRRRVSELQSRNDLLLSFFSTLPKDSLQAAPAELRALLPEARAEAPRPHTVLPTVGRKPAEMSGASPPADASPDMPNELPALLQQAAREQEKQSATPQPAAKAEKASALRQAIDAAEADMAAEQPMSVHASAGRQTPIATPSSDVKLLSRQKVPQLNKHSLDELRKDLFSPQVDDPGSGVFSSTVLSPVVESRAKKTSATPERSLRVVVPKSAGAEDEVMLTPLRQARIRARDAELATPDATPLRDAGRKGPRALTLASPGGQQGGSAAPTPTKQRAPNVGRRTPDNGRSTPSSRRRGTPGAATPTSKSPFAKENLEQEDSLRDLSKGKRGKKGKKPTRDLFMSRTGNLKSRPGTLVDSGEQAAKMREKQEERTKKADERRKNILRERQEKAARNAEKIKAAEKKKAKMMHKDLAAAGAGQPAAPAATGRVRNNDDIPITENHRGQQREMTAEEQAWRQQQLAPSAESEEEIARREWEAAELARVAAVRAKNTGLRPELAPAGGPRRGPGGDIGRSASLRVQDDVEDASDMPEEYLRPSPHGRMDGDDEEEEVVEELETGVELPAAEVVEEETVQLMSPSRHEDSATMHKLRSKWGELEFLLRAPLQGGAEHYATARQQVAAGRATLLELGNLGQQLDVRAGALLQWVLPYDNNTSIYAQWDVAEQEHDREQSAETLRFADQVGAEKRVSPPFGCGFERCAEIRCVAGATPGACGQAAGAGTSEAGGRL